MQDVVYARSGLTRSCRGRHNCAEARPAAQRPPRPRQQEGSSSAGWFIGAPAAQAGGPAAGACASARAAAAAPQGPGQAALQGRAGPGRPARPPPGWLSRRRRQPARSRARPAAQSRQVGQCWCHGAAQHKVLPTATRQQACRVADPPVPLAQARRGELSAPRGKAPATWPLGSGLGTVLRRCAATGLHSCAGRRLHTLPSSLTYTTTW
jgi:hypothetical protein